MLSVMRSKHKFMFESIMFLEDVAILKKYSAKVIILLLIIIIIDDLYNRRKFS